MADRADRPPAPEPLPHPVVDNHTHLDHARRAERPWPVGEAMAAAAAAGVTRMVQIGCDLQSARWTVGLLDEPAGRSLVGGVGLHPTEAGRIVSEGGEGRLEEALAEVERLAGHPRVRVIGETGLDHFWVPDGDSAARAVQERSFRAHIELAKRTGKVLQIHDRQAHADVLRVLMEEGAPERTVFHCFSGDVAMARFCTDRGWYLSFAGTITFGNASSLREALHAVPLDRVLVETDAPYLAPAPYRGRPNAGYLVPLTLRRMAEELGRDLESLCRRIDATSEAVYGPW